jgi:hypothetical protein
VAWSVLKVKVRVVRPILQRVGPYAHLVGLDLDSGMSYQSSLPSRPINPGGVSGACLSLLGLAYLTMSDLSLSLPWIEMRERSSAAA